MWSRGNEPAWQMSRRTNQTIARTFTNCSDESAVGDVALRCHSASVRVRKKSTKRAVACSTDRVSHSQY